MKQEPTQEQLDALKEFKSKYGWQWKNELRKSWESGVYPYGCQDALLQQVRNQLGPRWLNRAKI